MNSFKKLGSSFYSMYIKEKGNMRDLNDIFNSNIDSRNCLIKPREIEFMTKGRNRPFSYPSPIDNWIQLLLLKDLESLMRHSKAN